MKPVKTGIPSLAMSKFFTFETPEGIHDEEITIEIKRFDDKILV